MPRSTARAEAWDARDPGRADPHRGPDLDTGETVATVGVLTRVVQTLSFVTIQSNVLALVVAVALVVDPDRDGRSWRVLRLDALLGIAVTGLVFDLVLVDDVHRRSSPPPGC